MADKVKFGIKNVHIFPITAWSDGVPTYGTVIDVPGTVSLTLDKNGDTNDFYAFLSWGWPVGILIFAGITLTAFAAACLFRFICNKRAV